MIKCVNVNRAALSLYRVSSKDDFLKDVSQFFVERTHKVFEEEFVAFTEGKTVFEIESDNKTYTGERLSLKMKLTVVPGNEKTLARVIVSMVDLTKVKRLEEELRKAEQLAAIGRTANMVGHDLNNPLQVITNLAYLMNLKMSVAPLQVKEYFEAQGFPESWRTLDEQVKYMGKIVSDLKDYASPIKIDTSRFYTRQLVDDVIKTITIPENVAVTILIDDDLRRLEADPHVLQRVLSNLILNAVQAMPQGGKLSVEAFKKDESALIEIKDTGVGIPEENMGKLFTPHFTTKAKGTGLGLPVCKRLIEAHGGTITVESEVGKGSTFTVKISQKTIKTSNTRFGVIGQA